MHDSQSATRSVVAALFVAMRTLHAPCILSAEPLRYPDPCSHHTVAASEQATSAARSVKTKTITFSEGTDMAVTVSPGHINDHHGSAGAAYFMPIAGGAAKQRSTPYDEDSRPDRSVKGNVVTVQSYAGGTFHIWTMLPDGTRRKQITTGHGDDREPCISPDGTMIAFASDRAFKGSHDIWTVNLATGALKQITSSDADEFEPAWSPDGKDIAFVSGVGIIGRSIETINFATGKQHTIVSIETARGRLEAPSYSIPPFMDNDLAANEGVRMSIVLDKRACFIERDRCRCLWSIWRREP